MLFLKITVPRITVARPTFSVLPVVLPGTHADLRAVGFIPARIATGNLENGPSRSPYVIIQRASAYSGNLN
jgi:hypothetical protein